MKLEYKIFLEEFGYKEDNYGDWIVQYGDGYAHCRYLLAYYRILEVKNQYELRQILFQIYNDCCKEIKRKSLKFYSNIIPEKLTITGK